MVATPPFNISTSTPADNDIVSQFPANERTARDNTNQWLLTDHDTNGDHVKLTMPYQSSAPATPAVGLLKMYADVNGNLVYVAPDGVVRYVGVPPGTILWTAGAAADQGYVFANGGTFSRTGVGAALFARIGTIYGAGNGTTTATLPDIQGRSIAMVDLTGTRLTSASITGGGGATSLGGFGGSETHVLTVSELAAHNHGVTEPGGGVGHQHQSGPAGTFKIATSAINITTSGATPVLVDGGTTISQLSTGFATTNIIINNSGSGTPHVIVQPTIMLNAQIKL